MFEWMVFEQEVVYQLVSLAPQLERVKWLWVIAVGQSALYCKVVRLRNKSLF